VQVRFDESLSLCASCTASIPCGGGNSVRRLERRRNRSLFSRIHHRFSVEDASASDVAEYVGYRLKLAGSDKNIFAADAIQLMHDNTTGALRDIDRIAHGAMRDAARRKRKTVDREVVERVLAGRMPIA
jgi:general secretion pathway protein A